MYGSALERRTMDLKELLEGQKYRSSMFLPADSSENSRYKLLSHMPTNPNGGQQVAMAMLREGSIRSLNADNYDMQY